MLASDAPARWPTRPPLEPKRRNRTSTGWRRQTPNGRTPHLGVHRISEISKFLRAEVGAGAPAGRAVVAATGNTAGAAISAPARYSAVIAVGATDSTDMIATFTTTGPEMSVTAPGVDVYSCWDVFFSANTYTWQSGTSMACPHVAGLAALVWSANRDLTRHEVREIIESTAKDLGAAGWDPIYGHGRVDAHAAVVEALARRCGTGELNDDGVVDAADLGVLLSLWTN